MHIHIEPTPEHLVETIAARLAEVAHESVTERGVFSLVLAGGSTPRALYQALSEKRWRHHVNWQRTHIFFGDERAVPPDDEYSNYRMAREALLAHVSIPEENVHRMEAELDDLEGAARDYAAQLKQHWPLDLVLLGMGDDGHTASLFPQSPALAESTRLCVATPPATLQPYVRRLTLTLPAINAARHVWIIVTGEGKAARLKSVMEDIYSENRDIVSTPIQGVQPQGELLWLLDAAAARDLPQSP